MREISFIVNINSDLNGRPHICELIEDFDDALYFITKDPILHHPALGHRLLGHPALGHPILHPTGEKMKF